MNSLLFFTGVQSPIINRYVKYSSRGKGICLRSFLSLHLAEPKAGQIGNVPLWSLGKLKTPLFALAGSETSWQGSVTKLSEEFNTIYYNGN